MKKTPLKRKTPMKKTGFRRKSFSEIIEIANKKAVKAVLNKASRLKSDDGITSLSQLKRKCIRPVSKKRQKDNKEYTRLMKEFLLEHPKCTVCHGAATEIHHSCGRQGKRLTDVKFFKQLCSPCHRRVHDNPQWAKENNLLFLIK
jgi:hypothetical protein